MTYQQVLDLLDDTRRLSLPALPTQGSPSGPQAAEPEPGATMDRPSTAPDDGVERGAAGSAVAPKGQSARGAERPHPAGSGTPALRTVDTELSRVADRIHQQADRLRVDAAHLAHCADAIRVTATQQDALADDLVQRAERLHAQADQAQADHAATNHETLNHVPRCV